MSSNKFCLSKNSPSPLRTLSPIPSVHLFQKIKQNMPEDTAFLIPAVASCIRGGPFKPVAPSITTIEARKGSNKQEWSGDEITELINLWKQEEALYNSKCHDFSNCDE